MSRFSSGAAQATYTGPGSPGYDYSQGLPTWQDATGGSSPAEPVPGAYTGPGAEASWPYTPSASALPGWVKPVGIALGAVALLYMVTR